MDLLEELQRRVVCGDGAMGTVLLDAGLPLERCFEELNVSDPDRIRGIHEQYIAAGARVIKTNSFGANGVRLERFGMEDRVLELNRAAALVARKAAASKDLVVAGSIGPLGISSQEAAARGIDRAECVRQQVVGLREGGVELLFFETFTDFEEMAVAFRVGQEIGHTLAICSFACDAEGQLSDGLPVAEAIEKMCQAGAKIVGLNCMTGSDVFRLLLESPPDVILAVYPSAGRPTLQEGRFIDNMSPHHVARLACKMAAKGVRLIGGCCGTTPAHVQAIAEAIA